MKTKFYTLLFMLSYSISICAQQRITGTVRDADGIPVNKAKVTLKNAAINTVTDEKGTFELLSTYRQDSLMVGKAGYQDLWLFVDITLNSHYEVQLAPYSEQIEEVLVNTGYYQVPIERATGSFVHVDNKQINRGVSTNILERLEGVTSGVLFDRRDRIGEDTGTPEIRVRGISSIEGNKSPLIVVDNFPYDGDINSINPNDVESITVLRDAASASIWGARAGNGVIVITTKKGKYNQKPRVNFNGLFTTVDKPDLFYSQNYLPSETVMQIQKELFERNAYQERNQTYLPSYVELLIKRRDNEISETDFLVMEGLMKGNDVRREALQHLYQRASVQQYGVNISGGGDSYLYTIAGNTNRNNTQVIGSISVRNNLSFQNTFKAAKGLELGSSLWYSAIHNQNNGYTLRDLGYGTSRYIEIYDRLMEADGTPSVIGKNYREAYRESAVNLGLLDWTFRPLEERELIDRTSSSEELRVNSWIDYRFWKPLRLNISYQYVKGHSSAESFYDKDSYEVRNLVNRYTQANGTRAIPHGAILDYESSRGYASHSVRGQLNLEHAFGKHTFYALAGSEIRQHNTMHRPGTRLYAFDKNTYLGSAIYDYVTRIPVRPTGTGTIPTITGSPNATVDRFLSYFGNASYHYTDRYVFSGSIRWDGSNLLGVKTNQRGTSLYSAGANWNISNENFYNIKWMEYLRMRLTYGRAGNIDKSQSYYPTISLGVNNMTGLTQATLSSPGNPSLKWEQVNTLNFGLDWTMLSNRLSGSVEYYRKDAKDLLGNNLLDPTVGLNVGGTFKMNYADLRTQGIDLQLRSRNLTGKLGWESMVLLSTSSNKLTNYKGPVITNISDYLGTSPPIEGQSYDLIFSIPWYGLDPNTGYPIIYMDGEVSSEYQQKYESLMIDDLVVSGIRVPKYYGSFINSFSWKNIEVSFLMTYKFGSVFRRASIGPGQEYIATSPTYHMDYFNRWQKAGDELLTDVPGWAETPAPNPRFAFYRYGEALITKGDVIRLRDVNLSYRFNPDLTSKLGLQSLQLRGSVQNIGVIWKANKFGIDPEYPAADYPEPISYNLGVQLTF